MTENYKSSVIQGQGLTFRLQGLLLPAQVMAFAEKTKPAPIQTKVTSGLLSKDGHFIGIWTVGRVNTWLQSVSSSFALYSDPKQQNKTK